MCNTSSTPRRLQITFYLPQSAPPRKNKVRFGGKSGTFRDRHDTQARATGFPIRHPPPLSQQRSERKERSRCGSDVGVPTSEWAGDLGDTPHLHLGEHQQAFRPKFRPPILGLQPGAAGGLWTNEAGWGL
jgi:hypothetical protein